MNRRSQVGGRSVVFAAIALLLLGNGAEAYIDPGTGSALLYVVSGVIVSIYFSIRGLYYRLLDIVFRIRFREQRCDVAMHCEDPRYEITFLPVLSHLVAKGIRPTFFAMYERTTRTRRCLLVRRIERFPRGCLATHTLTTSRPRCW